jgi:fatty acid desaturase
MSVLLFVAPPIDVVQPATDTSDQDSEDGVCIAIGSEGGIREQLAQLGLNLPPVLYTLIQEFLTWLTGKPYWGQRPLLKVGRIYQLTTALLSLFGGIMASFIILQSSSLFLPLLIFSWAYTVGGARKIQATICHRCVHYEFFGDNRDKWLANILSTMLFVQDFAGYHHDHVKLHHHANKFASFEHDPDAQFLHMLGFRPAQES